MAYGLWLMAYGLWLMAYGLEPARTKDPRPEWAQHHSPGIAPLPSPVGRGRETAAARLGVGEVSATPGKWYAPKPAP